MLPERNARTIGAARLPRYVWHHTDGTHPGCFNAASTARSSILCSGCGCEEIVMYIGGGALLIIILIIIFLR